MKTGTITGKEILRALSGFEDGLGAQEGTQPAIIANRNFDPSQIEDAYGCYLNDSWAETIGEKLRAGFMAVRIQTEWDGTRHHTMIYLVKLKEIKS